MTSPKPTTPLSGRTKMITAASIAAVGLASLFAIGANLGILARADDRTVGTVSATGDLPPATAGVRDISLAPPTEPLAPSAATVNGSQHFTIDTAGTVDVSAGTDGAHLDLVSPNIGWTATPVTRSVGNVVVRFTNGTRTLEFTAARGSDGKVVGDLTEADPAVDPTSSDHHDKAGHHDSDDHHHDSDHKHDGSDDDD